MSCTSPSYRKLRPSDYFDINAATMLQLALKVENPKYVNDIAHKLTRIVVPLHTRTHGDLMITHCEEVPVYFLPSKIKTLQEAANFTAINYTKPFNKALASVAAGKDFVVLNINHLCSDGGYFKYIVSHLNDQVKSKNILPLKAEDIFSSEIDKAPIVQPWNCDPYITRISTNGNPKADSPYGSYFTIKAKMSDLMCYDKKTKSIKKFTETLWLSHMLAAFVHKHHIDEYGGVCTCMDLRNFLPKQSIDYSLTNCFSAVSPSSHISSDMKLSEVGRLMREDMEKKIKEKHHFGFIKSLGVSSDAKPIPGIGLEITNMGALPIQKPIVDAFVSHHAKTINISSIVSLMSFSVADDIYIRLRYGSGVLTHEEMNKYAKSIDFFIRNISLNNTVEEAYNEMMKI
ncbi:hypothetical protein GPJ56_002738 [Histomonas meleagridis]|uniref:uncharacterized protein n=1 Tax=Histomonas meleagridis TaxID=135588 RepID=UPI00355A0702|nr:hypothetical protein GPJ56_002738 [Histomonas meleagridis]KAH0800045.1 hypothetical protein GO595_007157 [Histomonas meleagridis]